jgi:agmatinase
MAKLDYTNNTFINNPKYPFSAEERQKYLGKDSKNYLISAPFEYSTSGIKGTKNGPKEIIQWSSQVELFDSTTLNYPYESGIYTEKPLISANNVEKDLEALQKRAHSVLEEDKFVGVLGGEHTVTYANVVAAQKHLKKPITVIVLDAHPDLYSDFYGEKYAHACVFKRLLDKLGKNIHLIQVGIRAFEEEELALSRCDNRVGWVLAQNIKEKSDGSLWLEDINTRQLPHDVWLSIDTDFFSHDVIQATGTPVAGGLGWWQTIGFLKYLYKTFNVVGFDVVELCPSASRDGYSAKNTAELVYKCFGLKK